MNVRSFFVALGLIALFLAGVPATDRYMPLDEVKPGMIGVGRTVFQGAKVEEFRVHVLGVLRNVAGPRRSLVLARLEGGPLADTGVIAGMSGSPVYIDGRLLGAISYSLGAFTKQPIAGITPIGEMVEAAALSSPRPPLARKARVEWPVTPERLVAAFRAAFPVTRAFADSPDDIRAWGADAVAGAGGATLGTQLRPIATPLVLGGFEPGIADDLASLFGRSGFLPVTGGSAGQAPEPGTSRRLEPGDAVGVTLIGGDLSVGATGTVTQVDGDRVYAFGHPFYNIGPTQFPMTRAYVHTLLPSLSSSSKIATTGEVLGTFEQDRATTIAGKLGAAPTLIPVKISLEADRGLKKSFSFAVVNDQLFTPLLTYAAILNTLSSYERQYGAASFVVTGRASVRQHGEIAFENIFTGESPSIGAASYIAGPITFLLTNDVEPIEIEAVDISIKTSEQPRTAKLERVWLDSVRPRPGKTVPLKVLMRTYRGEEVVRTVPIDIPANAAGRLSILVSDGASLAQWEQREMRQRLEPRNVAQMMRVLNKAHKNNRLYVKLLSSDPGGVVDGEYLSSLPPSVLAVFEADRNGGSFTPVGSATLGEWEIQTDHAVTGTRLLTISLDARE
jgi:hypothetical protein